MRTSLFIRTLAAAVVALLAGASRSQAANVALTASDGIGASSFNSAGKWNNGAAPSAGNDYATGIYGMRSPTGTTDPAPFAGNSLTLQPPTSSGWSWMFKGGGYRTYTINNLTNNGGLIRSGSGSTDICAISGNMMVITADSTILADQSPFVILSPLGGSATLTNQNNANQYSITYSNDNSAFRGKLVLQNTAGGTRAAVAVFAHPKSAPGNPPVATPDQITTLGPATLQDNAGVAFNNPNGGISINGDLTINAANAGTNTLIAEPITGAFNLIKIGGGILTLAGNNSTLAGVTLNGATAGSRLNLNNPNAIGMGTLTISGGNNGLLDNTSGSPLALVNYNPQTWQNNFAFVGSSSLDMGTGPVTIAGNITVTVSNNTLTVGSVSDGGLNYGLSKQGAGKLTLNGGGYYAGATTVGAGTLAITGSGATLFSTSITVASNATLDVSGAGGLTLPVSATLVGDGTLVGALTDNSATVIVPGATNSAGTLTVTGDLTLNGAGTMNFDVTPDATVGGGINDLIVVGGTLNLAGPTTLNLFGTPVAGTYTLFQYGSFAGSLDNLLVPPGFALVNNTAAKAVQLVVTHVPASLTWHGDGSMNTWDVGTTANWLQAGASQAFYAGDAVTFDNSGSSTPAITLSGAISPSATVVNASQDYDFTGSGILAGSLTKSGSGTLILENNNTYSGPTVINGGTLQVGNVVMGGSSGTLGTGPVTNNAALVFNRADALVVPNVISGSGSLTQSGYGTTALTASNSYSGATTISSGALLVQNSAALGSTNAGTTVAMGAQLYVTANLDIPGEALTLNGMGAANDGALRKGGGGVSTLGGPVVLGSDTTIKLDGNATLNLTNAAGLNGASANANLTLAGDGGAVGNISGPLSLGTGGLTLSGGAWTVAATNNYSGPTTLNGGTLRIADVRALGTAPAIFNASQVSFNGGVLEAVTNVAINDQKIGITLAGNGTLSVDAGSTLTISNDITGFGSLTKWLPGTLVLNGANSFSGTLYLDGGSGSANDGITRLTTSKALANVPVTPGTPTIVQRNNNGGYSTLQLDGSAGSITLAQEFGMSCRNNGNPSIENVAGNNTLSGNLQMGTGGNRVNFQSDAGRLTLTGANQYTGTLVGARSNWFGGAGDILVSGPIAGVDPAVNASQIHLHKSGAGTLTLAADNTYAGSTMVTEGLLKLTGSLTSTGGVYVAGGTLGGTGIINDSVTVQTGGTLAPGAGIGTLTINGGLLLQGTTAVEVSKGAGNDRVVGLTNITYGGTLVVSNVAGTLNLGDTFTLFSTAAASGNFANVTGYAGPGLAFSFNPTSGVLSVINGLPSSPTNLTYSVSGGNVTLGWPLSYTGWVLQAQTNALSIGLSTNWVDVAGSSTNNSVTLPMNPASPTLFFRLRHP